MGVLGSDLLSGKGEMTEVGSVFFNTYKDLQRCGGMDATTGDPPTATPSLIVAGESRCGILAVGEATNTFHEKAHIVWIEYTRPDRKNKG